MPEFDLGHFAKHQPGLGEQATVAKDFPGKVDALFAKHADYALRVVDPATGTISESLELRHQIGDEILLFDPHRISSKDGPHRRDLATVSTADMSSLGGYVQDLTKEPTVRRLDFGSYIGDAIELGDLIEKKARPEDVAEKVVKDIQPNIDLEGQMGVNLKPAGKEEVDHVFGFANAALPLSVSWNDLVKEHNLRCQTDSGPLESLTQAVSPFVTYTTKLLDEGSPDDRLVQVVKEYPDATREGSNIIHTVSVGEETVQGFEEKYPYVKAQITKHAEFEGDVSKRHEIAFQVGAVFIEGEEAAIPVLYSTFTAQASVITPDMKTKRNLQETSAPVAVYDEVAVRRFLRPIRKSK